MEVSIGATWHGVKWYVWKVAIADSNESGECPRLFLWYRVASCEDSV